MIPSESTCVISVSQLPWWCLSQRHGIWRSLGNLCPSVSLVFLARLWPLYVPGDHSLDQGRGKGGSGLLLRGVAPLFFLLPSCPGERGPVPGQAGHSHLTCRLHPCQSSPLGYPAHLTPPILRGSPQLHLALTPLHVPQS